MQGRSNNDSICWINTGMLFFWNLALSFVCHVLRLIRMNPIFFFLNETFHQENKQGLIYSWSNDCITHFVTCKICYSVKISLISVLRFQVLSPNEIWWFWMILNFGRLKNENWFKYVFSLPSKSYYFCLHVNFHYDNNYLVYTCFKSKIQIRSLL